MDPTRPTLQELEDQTRARVDAVSDDPEGRYAMRVAFYEKYGFGERGGAGYGTSELAFLRWEILRGVLAPLDLAPSGSPWWRAVNGRFLYLSELAGAVHEAGLDRQPVAHEVRLWLDYLRAPSAAAWYRAHNGSIVRGYLDSVAAARGENVNEQLFMNEVLYRLLFAEALVVGAAMGAVGAVIADPKLPAVEFLVAVDPLYPRHYPLDPTEVIDVHHLSDSLGDILADALDEVLVIPHLSQLYELSERTLGEPELDRLIKDGKPVYPDVPGLAPASPKPVTKKKIAILGGGMSGLTAAHELTRYPGWEDLYEVTVYQMGWRLGGKTATGRGPNQRIEEHGIHILQGWYDNTFAMLAEVYDERRAKKLDPRAPYQTWQEAFERDDATLITEHLPLRGWVNWPLVFPRNDDVPGAGPPLDTWQLIKKLVGIVLETALGSPYATGQDPIARWLLDHFFPPDGILEKALLAAEQPGWWHDVIKHVEGVYGKTHDVLGGRLLHYGHDLAKRLDEPREDGKTHPADVLLKLFKELIDHAYELGEKLLEDHDHLRRILLLIELTWVNVKGILADVWDAEARVFRFDRINDIDYRAWILKHGASKHAAFSAPVRFMYTGTFANLYGDDAQGGAIAAGSGLHFVLQAAGYKGSFVYKFRAGTGDTMIAPLYQVLSARGVRFELFREVEDLLPGKSGEIEAVTLGEQVTLADGTYTPTYRLDELTVWPAEPLYEQLDPVEAKVLQERKIDLEDPWANWVSPRKKTLAKGVDFDLLVLAIPVDALKQCCSKVIAEQPRWRAMTEKVVTVETISMQLWLSKSLPELGMNLGDWGMKHDDAPNTVVYENPVYSWIDMSLVLPWERYGSPAPRLLVYYTGPLRAEPAPPFSHHAFPEEQLARAKTICDQWLTDNMAWFWPKGAAPEAPDGLDYAALFSVDRDATPRQKFDAQYFRANVAPWAKFTLSVPGTARYRLRTDDSGYRNLFLTGDWIDYGMNVGYIEGAITSGVLAGQAVRRTFGDLPRRALLAPRDIA